MYYNIDAHELRAQAFLQAIKDIAAWVKHSVAVIKSQLNASANLGHTA